MLSSNSAVCCSKKSNFIKEQEASGSFNNFLRVKSTFEKIPVLRNINKKYKINEIWNKILLVGDKPGLTWKIDRKLEKPEVYSTFKDNIWGADLADMQLISKYNKRFQFLLRFINISSKCSWHVSLKDKKFITITNAFQKYLDETNPKPNKIWVDRESESYYRSMKSWLQDDDMERYSTRNEKKTLWLLKDSWKLSKKNWLQHHKINILIN